jgi:hypothetical protein
MHLNKLRDIKKIKGESFRFSRIGLADEDESSDDGASEEQQATDKDTHAFDIDSDVKNGRLVLMYKGCN